MAKLSGENALHFETYLLNALEAALKNGLALSPWLERFAKSGGVTVTTDQKKVLELAGSKRPFLFLEVSSADLDETTNRRVSRWLLEVSIEAITPVESIASEPFLKAAVLQILRAAIRDFEVAGNAIEESAIKAGQGKNQNPERINPHTFSCALHTLNA